MSIGPEFRLQAIGHVVGGRLESIDDDWARIQAAIELNLDMFGPSALAGLETFSHAEIVFLFDRVRDEEVTYDACHPRGRTDWPLVGIFAQRGKNRPNRLGVSVCRIAHVSGLCLEVKGLDAINGTPVLDVKPVMSGFRPCERSESQIGHWKL